MGIKIDMPKAREIKKNLIRPERDARLAALDVEFMKALEEGDVGRQNQIKAQKNRLRGAPDSPRIAAAQTPEELKSLTLDDLL